MEQTRNYGWAKPGADDLVVNPDTGVPDTYNDTLDGIDESLGALDPDGTVAEEGGIPEYVANHGGGGGSIVMASNVKMIGYTRAATVEDITPADNARTAIGKNETRALDARNMAGTALSTAEDAQGAANAAASVAESARVAAEQARTAAFSAQDIAGSAMTAANEAKTAAGSASELARGAMETVVAHASDAAIHVSEEDRQKWDASGVRENYLVNWDFTKPVNQRGKTIYSGDTDAIDGWVLVSGTGRNSTLELVSGGAVLTDDVLQGAPFHQKIAAPASFVGKEVTLSFDAVTQSDGDFRAFIAVVVDGVESVTNGEYTQGPLATATMTMPEGCTEIRCGVMAKYRTNNVVLLRGAKFELGSVSTLAADDPADYNEELAKCVARMPGTGGTYAFYVDAANGSDTNDGRTQAKAFATIRKAVSSIPKVSGNVDINLAPGTYDEDVSFVNLPGGRRIRLTGGSTQAEAVNYNVRSLTIETSPIRFVITGINFTATARVAIALYYGGEIYIQQCTSAQQTNYSALSVTGGTLAHINQCSFTGRTGDALQASNGAQLLVVSSTVATTGRAAMLTNYGARVANMYGNTFTFGTQLFYKANGGMYTGPDGMPG